MTVTRTVIATFALALSLIGCGGEIEERRLDEIERPARSTTADNSSGAENATEEQGVEEPTENTAEPDDVVGQPATTPTHGP